MVWYGTASHKVIDYVLQACKTYEHSRILWHGMMLCYVYRIMSRLKDFLVTIRTSEEHLKESASQPVRPASLCYSNMDSVEAMRRVIN